MMIISIIPVDKKKSKVFLEEGFAFVLYRSEVKRSGIEEGKEPEEAVYHRILDEVLLGWTKERALYLLKSSGKTEPWMKKKLSDCGYPEDAMDYTMNFLKECGFTNDRNYADSCIRSYDEKRSHRQLIYDLQQKGVYQEYIEEAFSQSKVDDEESARQLLCKRLRRKRETSCEEKGRLSAHLGRKGYSHEIINRVMRELTDHTDQNWQDRKFVYIDYINGKIEGGYLT